MRVLRLDGLRAVAIFAVFLHHNGMLQGGWLGVELFFSLSGFLITGILRRDRETPHFWKRFYIKRATRILPPVLLVLLLVALTLHPPILSTLFYLFFMGNFASTSRWDIDLLHTLWSLAVEEHFYLLFPFAVYYLNRTSLLRLIAGILLLEPVLRFFATPHFSDYLPIYFWTPFRLDGLASGALIAVLLEHEVTKAWLTRWAGLVGLVSAVIYGALSVGFPVTFQRLANTRFYNACGYTLVALTCTSIITYVLLTPESVASRLLGSRIPVFIGAISYGLYLCHQPLLMLTVHVLHYNSHKLIPLTITLCVAVSYLSFRFYEKPIINWGHRQASRLAA